MHLLASVNATCTLKCMVIAESGLHLDLLNLVEKFSGWHHLNVLLLLDTTIADETSQFRFWSLSVEALCKACLRWEFSMSWPEGLKTDIFNLLVSYVACQVIARSFSGHRGSCNFARANPIRSQE